MIDADACLSYVSPSVLERFGYLAAERPTYKASLLRSISITPSWISSMVTGTADCA